MSFKWEHMCDLDWLRKRQIYLTATDIKDLLPITATGRERKLTVKDYMKVYARKIKRLTQGDCISYGAAARGHILEPYAIDEFNKYHKTAYGTLFHWDDKIIPEKTKSIIAFSPDALNIPMESTNDPKILAEVKCYNSEKHLITSYSKQENLEERWQIATGLYCCPSIDSAYLILFDPSLKRGFNLNYFYWTREDLKEELKIIEQIESDWIMFRTAIEAGPSFYPATMDIPIDLTCINSDATEIDIQSKIEQAQRLNP